MTQKLLKLALEALKDLLDQTEPPPDKNCSCHIAPPCSDCVDYSGVRYAIEQANKTITAIKEALAKEKALQALHSENERLGLYKEAYAQPKKEPIAYINVEKRTLEFAKQIFWHTPTVVNLDRIPLFTQRTWVGLTDEEFDDLRDNNFGVSPLISAVEAKLKERNG